MAAAKLQWATLDDRIPYQENKVDGILNYNFRKNDNVYPQIVNEIANNSGTTSGCISMFKKFISGSGFEDEKIGLNLVSNKLTLNKLLDYCTLSKAMFNSFAIWVQYNALYEVAKVKFIPFPYLRFKFTEENRYSDSNPDPAPINKMIMYEDWGRRKWQRIQPKRFKEFNLYDPTSENIQAQVDAAGGWANYNGQVLYFTGLPEGEYPLCRFDAVIEDADSDSQAKIFRNRSLRNKFIPSGIMTIVGKYETDEERQHEQYNISKFQGADDSSNIIMQEVDSIEQASTFTPFQPSNTDTLYKNTTEEVKNSIINCFTIPQPLPPHQAIAGKLGLSHETYDAQLLMNSLTLSERQDITETFTELFSHFATPFGDNFNIKQLELISLEQLLREDTPLTKPLNI